MVTLGRLSHTRGRECLLFIYLDILHMCAISKILITLLKNHSFLFEKTEKNRWWFLFRCYPIFDKFFAVNMQADSWIFNFLLSNIDDKWLQLVSAFCLLELQYLQLLQMDKFQGGPAILYDGSSVDHLGFTKITINNVHILGNIKNAVLLLKDIKGRQNWPTGFLTCVCSFSLSVIYLVFAFANWIAAPIVAVTGPRLGMFLGGVIYT